MKGYKTLGLALLVAVVGVVQMFDFSTIVPQGQSYTGLVTLAIGAAIAALRFVTNTPVGKSD